MRLYFVRHAQSEANVTRRLLNRGEGLPLSAHGRKQAAHLAHELAGKSGDFTAIYSSHQLRAIQTATILSQSLGPIPRIAPGLAEYDVGIYDGRSDDEMWREYRRVIEAWMIADNLDAQLEGGESFNDIKARFLPVVESVIEEFGSHNGAVIMVGHAGTYRAMLPLVLCNIDNAFSIDRTIPNAGYVLADYGQSKLVCLEWCGDKVGNQGE